MCVVSAIIAFIMPFYSINLVGLAVIIGLTPLTTQHFFLDDSALNSIFTFLAELPIKVWICKFNSAPRISRRVLYIYLVFLRYKTNSNEGADENYSKINADSDKFQIWFKAEGAKVAVKIGPNPLLKHQM